MTVPDWLVNVDLWSVVIGVLVTLLGTRYPVVVSLLKTVLEWIKTKPTDPKPVDPAQPQPALPDLFPDRPLLSKLVKELLARLMRKHNVTEPMAALVAELDDGDPEPAAQV